MRLVRALVTASLVCVPSWSAAQQAHPADVSIDSSVAADGAAMPGTATTSSVVLDTIVSVGLPHGVEIVVRPWAMRPTSTGVWNRQIWVAMGRYQRHGRIDLRVEGGLIPSPVGLANMALRAPSNPTIAYPNSLFQPLPAFEPHQPTTTLLGALYPYGVAATMSSRHWDARAAVIDNSPLRRRMVFSAVNPPRFANVVVGAGLSPMIGLRVGGSVTHGGWQRASETLAPTPAALPAPACGAQDLTGEDVHATCDATLLTLEVQYAVRHTDVSGEWVRDAIQTTTGATLKPSGWFVQGQQTLTPRWFAAARVERMIALDAASTWQHFDGSEAVIGYRVTPDLTLRAGHRRTRPFGREAFDNRGVVSAVWSKRWK